MKVLIAFCVATLFVAGTQGQNRPNQGREQWRPNWQRQAPRQPNYGNQPYYPSPQNWWWGGDFEDAMEDGQAWAYMQQPYMQPQPYGYYQQPWAQQQNPGFNPRVWLPAAMAAEVQEEVAENMFSNSREVLLQGLVNGVPQAVMAGISNQHSGEIFDP